MRKCPSCGRSYSDKGKQDLGKIALAATALANGLFGLFASIPVLIIFIAIAYLT